MTSVGSGGFGAREGVGDTDGVGLLERVMEALRDWEGVMEALREGEREAGLGVGEGDRPGVGEGDGEGEAAGEGEGEAVGLGEGNGVALGEGDGVGVARGEGLAVCARQSPHVRRAASASVRILCARDRDKKFPPPTRDQKYHL